MTERRAVWRSNESFSREDLSEAVELFEETHEARIEQWRQLATAIAERIEHQRQRRATARSGPGTTVRT